jgi:hypothetical protein
MQSIMIDLDTRQCYQHILNERQIYLVRSVADPRCFPDPGSDFFQSRIRLFSIPDLHQIIELFYPVLWNRNRNRRNRNFLPCGTGTLTRKKVGTGTVINFGSGTGTRYEIMYLITFI